MPSDRVSASGPEEVEGRRTHYLIEAEVQRIEHLVEHRMRVIDILLFVYFIRFCEGRWLHEGGCPRLHVDADITRLDLSACILEDLRGLAALPRHLAVTPRWLSYHYVAGALINGNRPVPPSSNRRGQ